jgi:hypothetical protein
MATDESTVKPRRRAARSPAAEAVPDIRAARQCLTEHIGALRLAMNVIIVCGQALRYQDAELDTDIAEVMRCYGSDRLDRAIEEAEAVLASLGGPCSTPANEAATSLG